MSEFNQMEGDPPENSTATIGADGIVRTDAAKRPVTEEDVKKMAESEKELPVKGPRTILP